MIWPFPVFVILAILSSGKQNALAINEDSVSLYLDVQKVNSTDSLLRISELPIVYYKFLHDSVPDRIQLGAIGPEAQRLFPESIEVLPSATFTNTSALATGGRISTYSIRNFPIVDKTVLFMHGLASLQELLGRYDKLQELLNSLSERDKTVYDDIRKAQQILEQAINHQLATKLQTLELESKNLENQLNLESEREEEENRKQKAKLESEQLLLDYEEKLARERMQQQEQSLRETVAQQINLERDISARKELIQQENEAKLASLKESQRQRIESKRLEYEKEKIRAEIEARIQQERLNEEIQIKKIQLQAKLETERMVQGIKNVSQQLSSMIQKAFAHPEQLFLISGMFLAIVLCYYLIREFSSLVRHFIQQRLGRPVLVRETSYQWTILPSWLRNILSFSSTKLSKDSILQSWSSPQAMDALAKDFDDIILAPEDKERILQLALATRNTKRSAAPYRHVLLHGPPGTGKTLIARRLAACSAMDYAILSGGDVAPLGEDAVNQLHALFAWAQKSQRGLLVFIDEAEAFLCSRTGGNNSSSMVNNVESSSNNNNAPAAAAAATSTINQSTHLRNALNALLYQTGTPSRSFMMVLATNRPQDLDAAVLDRIDVSLQIGLPQALQRQALIQLYMHIHVTEAVQKAMRSSFQMFYERVSAFFMKKKTSRHSVTSSTTNNGISLTDEMKQFIDEQCVCESSMQEMLQLTQGFSGREISKLFISVQYVLLLSAERKLTWPMLRETVQRKAEEHHMKMSGFTTSFHSKERRSSTRKEFPPRSAVAEDLEEEDRSVDEGSDEDRGGLAMKASSGAASGATSRRTPSARGGASGTGTTNAATPSSKARRTSSASASAKQTTAQ